jgi:hypothetical protein
MPFEDIPRDDDEEDTGEEPLFISEFLADAVGKKKEEEKANRRLNFAEFRDDDKDDWTVFADGDSFPEKLKSLVEKSVLLPRAEFQLPIVLSYLMLPSALCTRVPILFSQGGSGCGKSTLGLIACRLHNSSPISAGSTFASIRNTVATMRRWDDALPLEHEANERNGALVWEDISPQHLIGENNHIFSLLKNGCERSGTITIAKKEGGNEVFKIFSPKYISSIHAIYSQFEFRELVRRLIVIQHKPITVWTSSDFDAANESVDAADLLDIGDIRFDWFSNKFRDYWESADSLLNWQKIQRSLRSTRNHGMSGNDFKMSKDLIACGVVCGYFGQIGDGLEHMRRYWEWHKDNVESQASATVKALSRYVNKVIGDSVRRNQELADSGMKHFVQPVEISASDLKKHVLALKDAGELDTNANIGDITNAMGQLGWELKPNSMGNNSWQPING